MTSRSPLGAIPPSVLVFSGIVSVQAGAGLAGRMFSQLGPAGVTGLRLWWAAVIIAVLAGRGIGGVVRQAVADRAWRDLCVAVAFGLVLGVMNFAIYQSFARIPLGVAVTIEFLGPLTVAVASSRRLVDLAWVIMAAGGVLLLTRSGTALAGGATGHAAAGVLGLSTQATGIGFALVAATCWAGYILLSRATGRRFSGSSGLVIAMVVAAVVVTGPAVAQAGSALLRPAVTRRGHGHRPAVIGHPLPVRAGGTTPHPGGHLRHLDEPGACGSGAGRPVPAERGPGGAAVAGHRPGGDCLCRGRARQHGP